MKTYKISVIIFFLTATYYPLCGQSYFQQEVNNKIHVTLNEIDHTLKGNIQIEYINNSHSGLDFIYMHLWPNAYKNENTPYAQQQARMNRTPTGRTSYRNIGYIDSLDFHVNNTKSKLNYIQADIAILTLPETLEPGDTIYITTDFFVKIPYHQSRLGYHEEFFCITQWFPKPAVYDEQGWHPMSYLNIGEFYSEFGSYDVSITLRDDYIVAATGNLITKKESDRLDKFTGICLETKDLNELPKFGKSEKTKTIRFVESNIHDFAWFASPDFIVNKDHVTLNDSGKTVNCWTFYDKRDIIWDNAINYVKNSVVFFSEKIGDYPYNNCSAVGSYFSEGGMEYPTITFVGANNKFNLDRTIAHEIAHNWFYGILANNERRYSWIDEGFTSFFENKYVDYYYPDMSFSQKLFNYNYRIFEWNKLPQKFEMELSCNYLMHENRAQAPSTHSEDMSLDNYFIMSYYKPALALYSLEKYLGEEDFEEIIQGLYKSYKYKHIYPENIEFYLKSNTSKDLNWFFEDILYSNKKTDYKIKGQKKDSIIIKNKGETTPPLFLSIRDSLIIADGFKGEKKFPLNGNDQVIIDKDFESLDYNRNNNYYRKKIPLFNKPLRVNLAGIIDNPQINQIPVLPAIAYNYTDGFMLGPLFYSPPVPKKKIEYQLIPMWAFKSEKITGAGNISLYFHPEKIPVRELELFISGKRFSINNRESRTFYKISTGLKAKLKTNPTGYYKSEILIRNISATDYIEGNLKNFQQIKYSFYNKRLYNPYSYSLNIESGKEFIKSSIEISGTLHYNKKRLKWLTVRLFAGKFLYTSNNYYEVYDFKLSGNLGLQDYLYDNLYIGRNEDVRTSPSALLAHQFVKNDGGFSLYTPYGQTNKWMIALNLDLNTFIPLVDLYFNIGVCPDPEKVKSFYEAGIKISIFKDFLNIYLPLTATKEIWEANNNDFPKNYIQKVRFTLSLEKLNPLNYRDRLF